MIGNVEIKVTHETLVEALQAYFNLQFAEGKAPCIVSIAAEQYAKGFVVQATGDVPPVI